MSCISARPFELVTLAAGQADLAMSFLRSDMYIALSSVCLETHPDRYAAPPEPYRHKTRHATSMPSRLTLRLLVVVFRQFVVCGLPAFCACTFRSSPHTPGRTNIEI